MAYAKHPEGGYTVDFNKPLINGKLQVIECRCENAKDTFVETATCTSNHLQVLDDALMTFYNLHSVNIRELFEYYTDDEMALELAGLIESFRSIGNPTLRSAVGRGIAKHLKEREEVEYLRDDEGNICRTSNHAAIHILNKGDKE